MPFTVLLGGKSRVCEMPLEVSSLAGTLALDFETRADQDLSRVIPTAVLASVSDGQTHGIVRPEQIPELIRHVHGAGGTLYMQNASFDLWVAEQVCLDAGEGDAVTLLRELIDAGRVFDVMIGDRLVMLALGDPVARNRNLSDIATGWLSPAWALDKEDPYRMRYGELLGREWFSPACDVEPGFFSYAVKDAIATYHVADEMTRRMAELIEDRGYPCTAEWGPLSHHIQLRSSWALAQVTRNGIGIDGPQLDRLRHCLWEEMMERLADLELLVPGCVKRWLRGPKDGSALPGEIKLTESGTPSKSAKEIQAALVEECEREGWTVPLTEKKRVSLAADGWERYRAESVLVDTLLTYEDRSKLFSWTAQLATDTESVHPRYDGPKTTGRTSAYQPSIQNAPKAGDFRHLFIPREPGNCYVIADYSAIEMVTLASVLLDCYGESVLADVLREGRDPHAFTASILLGLSYEEFLSWKKSPDKSEEYAKARQKAKPLNFGVPGGLGALNLQSYARLNYGVDMSVQEAKELRHRLAYEVYPELGKYLDDDPLESLARGLNRPLDHVKGALGEESWVSSTLRRIFAGKGNSKGGDYDERYLAERWDLLSALWRDSPVETRLVEKLGLSRRTGPLLLRDLLDAREPHEALERLAFRRDVVLRTGRVRAYTYYTESKNCPFQGLAADGATLAVYNLVRQGYKVVGFVHDEIITEVPMHFLDCDFKMTTKEEDILRICRIMISSMSEVVGHNLPIKVEAAVSYCWSKRAKLLPLGDNVEVWHPSMK